MKLKAPESVGDPCVGGVVIVARDGVYEVAPEIAALLIESFGFIATELPAVAPGRASVARSPAPPRRGKPPSSKSAAKTV